MEEDQQLDEGPERFDPVLLTQTKAERLAWFEKECTIEHTNLLRARDAILQTICSPGEGPGLKRLGTMVLLEKSIVLSIPLETNEQRPDQPSERLFTSK